LQGDGEENMSEKQEAVFECSFSSKPVCPYCGNEEEDAWEIDFGDGLEGDTEHDCGSCGETYFVSRSVSIYYSTQKL
jgi:hypothetical protein